MATPALAGPYTRLQVLLPGEAAAPGTATGRTGVPSPQTAGVPFYATVRACDDAWELVPTVTNTVRILSTDASASLPAATQLQGGTGQFLVILNSGGDFTIFARDEVDVTVTDGASSSLRSIVLQTFAFSNILTDQSAGVSFSLTISARDASGELVSGFSGEVRLRQLTTFGEGRISPSTVNMDAGEWSGSVTVFRADESDPVNGRASVSAEIPGNPSQSGASSPFVVSPGAFTKMQIVAPGQAALPGSVSGISGSPSGQTAGLSFTVQVYGTDDYWNPVATSDQVQVASSTDPADTPVSGNLSAGARQFSYALQSVGSQTLTVTNLDDGSIAPMTSASIQVTPASTNGFAFTAIGSPQVAGIPVNVQIRAVDSSGNTDYEYSGDAVLAANTGSGTSTPTLITFTGGVWSGPVTFFGAGAAVRLTCTDFGSPPRMGTSGGVLVNPASVAKMQIVLPGEVARGGTADGLDGRPNDQLAGTSFPIAIRAVDQYWNVVSGISDRIAIAATDSFAHLPADTTLTGGTLNFPGRLFASGPQTITVTNLDNPGIAPYTTRPVQIVGGTFSKVLVLAPGEMPAPGTETGRTGPALDQSINYAFTLTVLAADEWWNPVAGPTDMVRITSTDPLAELPADQAMVDGRVELPIRLSTGGYQTIQVEDLTNPSKIGGFTEVRAISSGFHLVAETQPTEVKAGDQFTLTVRVTNDAGALIQEVNSAITVEVLNSTSDEPGRGTLLTPQFELQGGERSVPQMYTAAEPIILVVSDDEGSSPASSNVLNVLAGPPAGLHLSSDPEWVRGNRNATISALLVDQFENGVPGEAVFFEHVTGGGVLTPTDPETDGTGIARADFLSPRFPEMNLIRATSGAFEAELDLQVALVDPAADGGYLTNYPNPFHPGEAPTTIAWKLDNDASVQMRIFTLAGNLVLDQRFDPGQPGGAFGLNEITWNGRNGDGDVVASGGYILSVQAQSGGETIHNMRRKVGVVR
jgi:hypothetical protein